MLQPPTTSGSSKGRDCFLNHLYIRIHHVLTDFIHYSHLIYYLSINKIFSYGTNEVQVVLGNMLFNGNAPRSSAGELRDNHFVSATGGTFCWCELCRFTRQCMIIYDSACKCTEKKYRKALIFSCFFLTNINRHVHIYIYIYTSRSVCSFCFHISWCECWPHKSCSHPWGLLFHRRNAMAYSCQWARARFQASISGGMVMQGSNRSIKRCWEVLQVCLRLLLKISLLKTSTVCRSMSLHLII